MSTIIERQNFRISRADSILKGELEKMGMLGGWSEKNGNGLAVNSH